MAMTGKKINELIRKFGRAETNRVLTEGITAFRKGDAGGFDPTKFSIRDLYEHLVVRRDGEAIGKSLMEQWEFNAEGEYLGGALLEAGEAVDSTMFANITGQIVFSSILAGYQYEGFFLSNMVPTIPSRIEGQEKIPGIGKIKEDEHTDEVREGQPYPHVGFSEEYILIPAKTKQGLIVDVTREAVFYDRTGLVLTRANEVGQVLGIRKEKRLLDVLIGATSTYAEKRRGMTTHASRNTYYAAADSSPPWINHLDGNDLVDWTALDAADQLFSNLRDPNTGEPIMLMGRSVMCAPAKAKTLNRIINATEVRETTNTSTVTLSASPIRGVSGQASALLRDRIVSQLGVSSATADDYWFYGDFARAFAWVENWGLTTAQAPSNSEAEFDRDIVAQYKAGWKGVAAVMEPRAVTRHRALATSSSGS